MRGVVAAAAAEDDVVGVSNWTTMKSSFVDAINAPILSL